MKKIQVMIVTLCVLTVVGIASDANAGAIGNTVWNDRNANGVQDVGEEGISGVKVKLYNGNDKDTDVTNSIGRYKFTDLDAGHYTLIVAQETLPEGCYATYDRDGNKDGKYADKYVKEDDYYTHVDFGYHCPITTYVSSGHISPVTGPNTMTVILITALVAGLAVCIYKRQNKNNSLKK